MCEHNTSSASGLLTGRKKSSWGKKYFAVEKGALALVSRKWKACLCRCRKSSEFSALTNVLNKTLRWQKGEFPGKH